MKAINVFCFLGLFLFSINVFADELNVDIDKNVMTEGDVLYLTIEYDGSSNENPDLSSLQNDFQVVSNSTSKQITLINGVLEQTKKWTVGVKPLRSGKIVIKPIKLGGLSSNYSEVEVKEITDVAYIPDSKNNYNSPYFKIEQSTDLTSAYLNQQVLLYVTIYDSLGLRNGTINIDEKVKDDWIIVPLLKNPIVKKDVIDGRKMNVINFVYAIFPQKTGELEIPQFSFEGEYIKDVGFSSPDFGEEFMMFGMDFRNAFGQKVPVRMKADAKVLNVLMPKDKTPLNKWFPVKNLQVSSFIGQKNNFMVSEAFNQKVIVKATGATQTLLPNIEFPQTAGLKQYPEKPEIKEDIVNGNVVTTATYNVVYIPTQRGNITIPPIEIKWFNVNNNQFETASTNEVNLVIAKSDMEEIAFPNDNSVSNETEIEKKEIVKKENNVETKKDYKQIPLIWYLAFGGIVLILLLVMLISKKQSSKNAKYYKKLVISSILKHDYAQTKIYLLEWAKIKYNNDDIKNFKDVEEYSKDVNFEKELDTINKLLYSKTDEMFDSQNFVKIFKKVDKTKVNNKNKQDVLPNLYK
ncbi:MAG: BatD family protein [Alphaproteobacteria bacterium]|nr:BatD family protein [Alphaproteobacteria bacterium]